MPREARSKYENDFFHVMTQGINKENIFYNDKYKRIYIKFMFDNAKKYNIKIIAYCIMINHAHLLLEINDVKEMSKFMKMINMKYAMLYNDLEKRVGVVFRNRFESECIHDEKYFYNCIHYIHNNPVKAGIVKNVKEYKFSSANNFDLGKILNELNERISKQEYEKVSFIDTEEDKKAIINNSMTRIIDDFRHEHNMVEVNLQNKDILRQLIVKIKEETKADNTEIAKMFRGI